jgi:hypothetical protein
VGRYIFTKQDLAPLSKILARPEAMRVAARAIPVKRMAKAPKMVDAVVAPLPVQLRTRGNPGGIPLGDVSSILKERVPGVSGVVVRDKQLLINWDHEPTPDERAQATKVLSDRALFEQKHPPPDKQPPVTDEQLKTRLLSADTPDAEWLASFRTYQTKKLAGEQPK